MQPPLLIARLARPAARGRPPGSGPGTGCWRAARSLTLDAQLAAGRRPPTISRLRQVRARQLTSPRFRERLAARWESLLRQALDPKARRRASVAIPVQHTQIAAAQREIRRLIDTLNAGVAAPARGVAIASLLLTDGSGPVYNRTGASALKRRSALRGRSTRPGDLAASRVARPRPALGDPVCHHRKVTRGDGPHRVAVRSQPPGTSRAEGQPLRLRAPRDQRDGGAFTQRSRAYLPMRGRLAGCGVHDASMTTTSRLLSRWRNYLPRRGKETS